MNAFDSRRARCVTRAAVDSTGRLTGWASLLDVFEIAKRSCCACTRSRCCWHPRHALTTPSTRFESRLTSAEKIDFSADDKHAIKNRSSDAPL